jgi:predicted MPP superfamily phosphohydrolase
VRRLRQEAAWFSHTRHRLPLPGLKVPLRVLHLTDSHLRATGPWLDQLCEQIAACSADLVLLTGDLVTFEWEECAISQFLDALPEAPLGRWAVLGNWEHWANRASPERWRPLLRHHGVELLVNESRDLGPVMLAGTDDHLAGVVDLDPVLCGLGPQKPGIVMTHSPGLFPKLAGPGVDLVLSGHSHGGQIRLPLLGSLWVPHGTEGFVSGWYSQGSSQLFVSRGLGWSIAPVRMWCRPEIATIELIPSPDPTESWKTRTDG